MNASAGDSFRLIFLAVLVVIGGPFSTRAEIYACKQPDGTEIYSDRSISHQCRKLQNLPKLIPAPTVPSEEGTGQAKKPAVSDAPSGPVPGGGRHIDPPSDDSISIREIKAIPNYNNTLGIARYQANMRLQNIDPDWTAQEVCLDVRFRDVNKVFIDVRQTGCLKELRPLDDRVFSVVYTGSIPPRLSPIEAEVHVSSVKWVK